MTQKPVTKPTSAASKPLAFRDTGAVTELAPLLSDVELQEWAEELEIDSQSMDRLHALISRRSFRVILNFLVDDPQEAARWITRELGWGNCLDFQEALSDAIDAADDASDSE